MIVVMMNLNVGFCACSTLLRHLRRWMKSAFSSLSFLPSIPERGQDRCDGAEDHFVLLIYVRLPPAART